MNLLDEVAALPGGPAVHALLTQIDSADPTTMSDIAIGWQQAATQYSTTATTLTSVARLSTQWTGASAAAFDNYADLLIDANNSLAATLTKAACSLEDASTAVVGDQCLAATLCESLVAEVENWDMAHPHAVSVQRRAAIGSLCQETVSELQQLVSSISAVLTTLSGVFGQVSGHERPFDIIKPPRGSEIVVRRRIVSAPTERTAVVAPVASTDRAAAATPATSGSVSAARPLQTGGLSPAASRSAMSAMKAAVPARMSRPQSPAGPMQPASPDQPSGQEER